jgi:hypothetical protein
VLQGVESLKDDYEFREAVTEEAPALIVEIQNALQETLSDNHDWTRLVLLNHGLAVRKESLARENGVEGLLNFAYRARMYRSRQGSLLGVSAASASEPWPGGSVEASGDTVLTSPSEEELDVYKTVGVSSVNVGLDSFKDGGEDSEARGVNGAASGFSTGWPSPSRTYSSNWAKRGILMMGIA